MGTDFWIVVRWWGTLFLVGAVAFPLTKKLFSSWYDRGYFFAKAAGMALVTFFVYLFATIHMLPFTIQSIFISMGIVFVAGLWANIQNRGNKGNKGRWVQSGLIICFEELFFFLALLFWAWVKGHESSIQGLEKFMDFGFMKSILDAGWFPAPDMWYAGSPINYYYFGHTVVAVLTKLSGIDLAYTFNLMLAAIFAFTLTMSFSIGYQLLRGIGVIGVIGKIGGGILTAFLVTLAGNMQTIYAFTKGYMGENPPAFWTLLWKIPELGRLGEGLERYWYANATRFIPFTIHEFPSYSFVVSDVHGHVLSLPFVLLAIALLIQMFSGLSLPGAPVTVEGDAAPHRGASLAMTRVIFYGFLCGVLLMTNASDGPIYMGLFIILIVSGVSKVSKVSREFFWKYIMIPVGLAGMAAGLTSLPFLFYFKSFVSGIAVNCPPAFLAGQKFGPILFETAEKCQHSPLWMSALLWGFFISCGAWLIGSKVRRKGRKWHILYKEFTQTERILVVFFVFSVVLIIFPEFFYFKDIYPAHFRSNTMFKLGYQAFILFSIVSGYTIVQAIATRDKMARALFILFFLPQLFLVSIYPVFSVRSYFNSLKNYQGLYGLTWLAKKYPDDYKAIMWLNTQARGGNQGGPAMRGAITTGSPVIIEADGDSYTDYARVSAFTGLPTVVGWAVHEWLWRGTYDVVAPRREEVRTIYESDDPKETKHILTKYNVRYIIVGTLEREKYPDMNLNKFDLLGSRVFTSGRTTIYLAGQ